MTSFYIIKEFASNHFYKWEEGEDFIWLKDEWHKFESHLKTEQEVEDFILTLSEIYEHFCSEAYFAKITDEDAKKYDWIIKDPNPPVEKQEITKRLNEYYDRTLDILLEVYGCPDEILRQFISIAIDFEVPHPDCYKFIDDLFRGKFIEPDKNIPF